MKFVALLLISTAVSAATIPTGPKITKLTCGTAGDALGGLTITASGSTVTMLESTMAGTTVTYSAQTTPQRALAMTGASGGAVIFQSKGSAAFGGAVSNAALLVVFPKAAGAAKREGYLSRGGTVFTLGCQ